MTSGPTYPSPFEYLLLFIFPLFLFSSFAIYGNHDLFGYVTFEMIHKILITSAYQQNDNAHETIEFIDFLIYTYGLLIYLNIM